MVFMSEEKDPMISDDKDAMAALIALLVLICVGAAFFLANL